MKSRFEFRTADKIRFYLMYFIRKTLFIWFEVRVPKFRMFLYEMMYSARKIIDRNYLMPSPFRTTRVETKFGRFVVRPGTLDMSNVSPAYEREDINYLLIKIDNLLKENKKVLFLDIGADLGTFTVTVGNRFRGRGGLSMMSFEPAPSNFRVLKENIGLNGLSDVAEPYPFALWSEDVKELQFKFNPSTPGSSGLVIEGAEEVSVPARKLDGVLDDATQNFDAFLFKMDVEGVESEVLMGAEKTLASGKEIYILVEDFVNPKIVEFLESRGAEFLGKLTPYNSWWRI